MHPTIEVFELFEREKWMWPHCDGLEQFIQKNSNKIGVGLSSIVMQSDDCAQNECLHFYCSIITLVIIICLVVVIVAAWEDRVFH